MPEAGFEGSWTRVRRACWRWPWLTAWIGVSVILVPALSFRRKSEWVGCYAPAARRVAAGLELPGPEGWVYPPFFTVPVFPFVWLPEGLSRIAWCFVLVTSIVLALRFTWNTLMLDEIFRLAVRRPGRFVAFVLLMGGAALGHAMIPLSYQAHDLIIVMLLAAGGWSSARALQPLSDPLASGRERAAGICFGLAASCKVMPVLFLPVLAVQRRLRAATSMAVTGLAAAAGFDLVTWICTGQVHFIRWMRLAAGGGDLTTSGGGHWSAWNPLNQSGTGILTRLMVPTPASRGLDHECMLVEVPDVARRFVLLTWILLVIGSLLVVGWRTAIGRMARADREGVSAPIHTVATTGATACAYLLVAPHTSNYHFAPLAIVAAAMSAWLVTRRRDPVLVIMLGLMIIIELIPGRDILGGRLANIKLAYGSVGLCALAGFVGCLRTMTLAARPSGAGSSGRPEGSFP